jgi:hypothetical protein
MQKRRRLLLAIILLLVVGPALTSQSQAVTFQK